jgi:hypothetical protein
MSNPVHEEAETVNIDVLRILKAYGRSAILAAVAAAALVAAPGWWYLQWGQPVRRWSYLEFRPTFSSAAQMRYPNNLPFSPSDVTAGPVLDLVYDTSEIEQYCAPDEFRAAFFVEQRSDQSVLLDLEYQARLAEARVELVERRVLEEEYAAKRLALPLQYRLVFVAPSACSKIPGRVVDKLLVSVLATWASESETKRGVLNHQVEVLSPGTLDVTSAGPGGWVLGADLLRTALERIIRSLEEVAALPGAALVRLGPERLTFMELRGKLLDLLGARLEPLVMTSGRSLVRESFVWVNETVNSAVREQDAAEGRANVYQAALREFSGATRGIDSDRAAAPAGVNSSGVQTLTPQIDRSFIDRIIEMSSATAEFRRELTENMVAENLAAVSARTRASYYRRLLQSLRESGSAQLSQQDLEDRLGEIVAEGKVLTKQFGDLYDEFSRVALRPAAALYRTDKPVATEEIREFTWRQLTRIVAAAFFAALLLTFAFLVIRERMAMERS